MGTIVSSIRMLSPLAVELTSIAVAIAQQRYNARRQRAPAAMRDETPICLPHGTVSVH